MVDLRLKLAAGCPKIEANKIMLPELPPGFKVAVVDAKRGQRHLAWTGHAHASSVQRDAYRRAVLAVYQRDAAVVFPKLYRLRRERNRLA
jgi:hypothetical protein